MIEITRGDIRQAIKQAMIEYKDNWMFKNVDLTFPSFLESEIFALLSTKGVLIKDTLKLSENLKTKE